MKKRNLFFACRISGLALGAVIVLLALSGCETDSAGKVDVRVTPATAELSRGQSIELTASGWEDYRWSLGTPAIGNLSATVGQSVVYTATRSGGSDDSVVEQVVTARAITSAAPVGTATNQVLGLSATSRIRHR